MTLTIYTIASKTPTPLHSKTGKLLLAGDSVVITALFAASILSILAQVGVLTGGLAGIGVIGYGGAATLAVVGTGWIVLNSFIVRSLTNQKRLVTPPKNSPTPNSNIETPSHLTTNNTTTVTDTNGSNSSGAAGGAAASGAQTNFTGSSGQGGSHSSPTIPPPPHPPPSTASGGGAAAGGGATTSNAADSTLASKVTPEDAAILNDWIASVKEKDQTEPNHLIANSIFSLYQEHKNTLFRSSTTARAFEICQFAMQELCSTDLGKAKLFLSSVDSKVDQQHLDNPETLDQTVFHASVSRGVQVDIPKASASDQNLIHLFQVASQYNCSETTGPYLLNCGEAMSSSQEDFTQGPLAQRTNPRAFEIITAFLSSLGINMLEHVTPSAGRTDEHKHAVFGGYLMPANTLLETIAQEFKGNYHKLQSICYSSHNPEWAEAKRPVYLLLQAAPAIAYYEYVTRNPEEEAQRDVIEKYASLANYICLFHTACELANENGKPFVVHANAPGSGQFGNKLPNITWGFHRAASAYQALLKARGVTVQIECFQGHNDTTPDKNPMTQLAHQIGIEELKARAGE